MAGDKDRHEQGPTTARRVGRGAAAAIGGATLSLPVAASAMAMPVCACGGGQAPPQPDPKPTPSPTPRLPKNLSVEDQEAIQRESAPPPPQQAAPAPQPDPPKVAPEIMHHLPPEDQAAIRKESAPPPPPPTVHPNPDAQDADRRAREQRDAQPSPTPSPQPGPPPQPDPPKVAPQIMHHLPPEDQEAIRKESAPPPPPPDPPKVAPQVMHHLPPEDQEAIRKESAPPQPPDRIPSVVEKQPPAKPPMSPLMMALLDPLAYLRGAPTPPSQGTDPYPTDGPALAGAPYRKIGLGFEGTTEKEIGCSYGTGGLSCLHVPLGPPKEPGPSVSVELSHTEVKKRGGEDLDENGRHVSLEVSGDWKLSESVGFETKKEVDLDLERNVTRSVSYEATLDPKRAEAISNHEEPPPNPIDPASLQKGEGVVFSHEKTSGDSEKVSYKLVSLGTSHDSGTRQSTGVTRVDDKTVRVYVGDEDLVRNAVSLGIGIDEIGASIGNSTEFADGKLRQVDINDSTPAGREAYRRFVATGTLPDAKTDGVTDSAVADTAKWSSSSDLSVHAGPIKLGISGGEDKGVVTDVHHADGRVEHTFTTDEGDVGAINTLTEQKGMPDKTSYTLLLQNVDHDYVDGYQQLRGVDQKTKHNRDLRIDFTDAELNQMRDQAVEHIVDYRKRMGEPLSPAQVRQQIHKGIPVMDVKEEMIAGAKNPADVLDALNKLARSNSTEAVDVLERFTVETWGAEHRRSKPLGTVTVMSPAP